MCIRLFELKGDLSMNNYLCLYIDENTTAYILYIKPFTEIHDFITSNYMEIIYTFDKNVADSNIIALKETPDISYVPKGCMDTICENMC